MVMQVKLIDLGDAADFLAEAITPPEARSVQGSIANLVGLGALSAIPPPLGPGNRKLTYELTPLGVHLAMLVSDLRLLPRSSTVVRGSKHLTTVRGAPLPIHTPRAHTTHSQSTLGWARC
jgi:hypothetical protein